MDRQTTLLWMKDLLEHLAYCHEQSEMADSRSERYLLESMKRDVDEFRRLCDVLSDQRVRGEMVSAA